MKRNNSDLSPCTHIGHGIRVHLDWGYHRLAHEADRAILERLAAFPKAQDLYAAFLADLNILALWDVTAYMAVEKMGYNDHGQMHAQIVAANVLQLLHLLHRAGIELDVVTSGAGTLEDAYIVALAAALLHDVGNSVARDNHELYSVALAQPMLARLLSPLYPDSIQTQVLAGFVLSAIASHDCNPNPLTLEGAIVAVADAADMTQGRGQVAFDRGKADIHAISAMAIQRVAIQPGDGMPAHIEVTMTNPAGLFQVEKLLSRRLVLSGLERYVSLRACVVPAEEQGDNPLRCLVLHEGRFLPETVAEVQNDGIFVDPVCGMAVAPTHAAGSVMFQGERYYFCSPACLTSFQDNPSILYPGSDSEWYAEPYERSRT